MRRFRLSLILLVLVSLVAALPATAQRGNDSGRASKNGKVEGTIDGVAITVEFGRPQVKGRTIWGGLVPYGKVWRTGADEATTIELSAAAKIEGQALPAGKYSLFTIPGQDEWVIVFNKTASQWGAFSYDQSQDALRVTVEPRAAEHVEAMNFEIDGSSVVLRWDKVAVPFTVSGG